MTFLDFRGPARGVVDRLGAYSGSWIASIGSTLSARERHAMWSPGTRDRPALRRRGADHRGRLFGFPAPSRGRRRPGPSECGLRRGHSTISPRRDIRLRTHSVRAERTQHGAAPDCHDAVIMGTVRRALALVVLAMVGVVLTADPFCCADGCTNGQQTLMSGTATSCSLCQSSVTIPSVPLPVRVSVVRRVFGAPPRRDVSSPASRIERPPRLA
jgi:hypothetical protein